MRTTWGEGGGSTCEALDATDRFLRAMLRRTVVGVLGGGLGLFGCASSSLPAGSDSPVAGHGDDGGPYLIGAATAPPTPPMADGSLACPANLGWEPMGQVYLGASVDYLGLYQSLPTLGAPAIDETGTPCAIEGDRRPCLSALAERVRDNGPRLLAATRGDEIFTFDGSNASAVLGPIDSQEEAAIVAFLNGYEVTCEVRVDSAGAWRVSNGCENEVMFVERDGSVRSETAATCPSAPPEPQSVPGRRPPGLLTGMGRRGLGKTGAGAFFARAAHYEAASVFAFRQLGRELRALGAPRSLCQRADRAAREEVTHARVMAGLARRHGARPVPARVRATGLRDWSAIALDNAVEGCVHETFSAALALFQARRATDPAVRAAMARIAVEEARHAGFSLQLHRHGLERLGRVEGMRIEDARKRAADALRAPSSPNMPAHVAAQLGLPSETEGARLADALRAELLTA